MNPFIASTRQVVIALTSSFYLLPVLHAAEMSEADLAVELSKEFKGFYSTTARVDAMINKQYGQTLPPEKAAIARASFQTMMNHPNLSPYLAKILAPAISSKFTPEELRGLIAQSMAAIKTKGVLRLSTEKQAGFVTHIANMAHAIAPEDCRAMYTGEMDATTSNKVELRYILSLPPAKFASINNLYKDSVMAELSGYPDVRTITAEQASLAEKVLNLSAGKKMAAILPSERLAAAANEPKNAPAADVCAALTAYTESITTMPEPYRSWQLVRFAESMQ